MDKTSRYIFIRIPEGSKEVTSYFTFNGYSRKKGCLCIDESLAKKSLFDVDLPFFLQRFDRVNVYPFLELKSPWENETRYIS